MSVHNTAGVYDPAQMPLSVSAPVGGSPIFWAAKRAFDIVMSLALLPLFGVFVILLTVLNRRYNKGPLFFHQTRMGHHLQPFTAIKFRSMQPAAAITRAVDDPIEDHRITALGRVLRKTRIDELPQILNVLAGEMSLIGPRPDYIEHAREYLVEIPEYRARHLVRPGISGLAQVTLGYAEGLDATRAKATADLAYIRNASFGLELRVFWLTLVTVFMRRGA